jgi:hypothetical protein
MIGPAEQSVQSIKFLISIEINDDFALVQVGNIRGLPGDRAARGLPSRERTHCGNDPLSPGAVDAPAGGNLPICWSQCVSDVVIDA